MCDDIIICVVVAGDKKNALDSPLKEAIMWNPDNMNNLTEEEGGSIERLNCLSGRNSSGLA